MKDLNIYDVEEFLTYAKDRMLREIKNGILEKNFNNDFVISPLTISQNEFYNNQLKKIDQMLDICNKQVRENDYIKNKEMINHPQHYNMGKFEAIDVIEDWQLNFNLGNTVKYISRAGHKDDIIQDLKKALWYLDREIKRLEKGE